MSVEVQMIPAAHLLAAREDLKARHWAQGRISHACGVQTAINLVLQAGRRSAAQSVADPATANGHTQTLAEPAPGAP